MTKEQQKIFAQTAQRLSRCGILDPTAQIVALAEEIELYRDKIRSLTEQLQRGDLPEHRPRYTRYNADLDRYVVPCLYKADGGQISFYVKQEPAEKITNNRGEILRAPGVDLVFGEVIDRLAELETKMVLVELKAGRALTKEANT